MAFYYPLAVGHFVPDQQQHYVVYRDSLPLTTRVIDQSVVNALLASYLRRGAHQGDIPEAWHLQLKHDAMVGDKIGTPPVALRFIADYAEQTDATIIDHHQATVVNPSKLREWAAQAETLNRSADGLSRV